jgi:hypothetical protein
MNRPHRPPLRRTRVRWTHVAMTILCAAMAFGGTFTCKGSNNGDSFTRDPSTGA